MGKKDKKTGKGNSGRLDKYYHLAKEQGYRARSAFKLIQLNKKYNFLERSRVLIDLCAAPGGIDLVPIKPIPKVITLQNDITTEKCVDSLRHVLKSWKADTVLHDGAPNVGVSWVQDAFSQSELTLMALKLVVESKDYNNLIWVFNQLFKKVEATKPASSRNVSAEIYVICKDFLAPKKIDPKFLDPRSVFKDLEIGPPNKSVDVLHPDKKKRHRDGYEDGNYTLYKKVSIMEFVNSDDPVRILGDANTLEFDSDEAKMLLNHESTKDEIKISCEDLKVLGKREFKNLLKWRSTIRVFVNAPKKEKVEVKEIQEPVDEDQAIQEELDTLTKEDRLRRKRLRRKANEKKQKNITRMQLKMINPTDIALDQVGPDSGDLLFDLRQVDKAGAIEKVRKGDMDITLDNDEEKQDDGDIVIDDDRTKKEAQLDEMYEDYKERKAERDAKYRAKKMRRESNDCDENQKNFDDDDKELNQYSDSDSSVTSLPRRDRFDDSETTTSDSSDSSNTDSESDRDNNLVAKKNAKSKRKIKKLITELESDKEDDDEKELSLKSCGQLSKKAALFFDQPLFKGVINEEEKNYELSKNNVKKEEKIVSEDKREVKQPAINGNGNSKKRKADEMEKDDNKEDENDDIVINMTKDQDEDEKIWDVNESDEDEKKMKQVQKIGLLTPEAITLAKQLVNRQKTKQELIDAGFTRYAFYDKEGLPEWFLDDEKRHNQPNLPITKEAVELIRERMKALNARPIKKIAEAKAKKKMRALNRLAKLQKKTDAIAEKSDMTEREKSQTITKILSKAQKQKKEVKVVVAKGAIKGTKGRPKGVKGRYKMVDARMKKEVRAMDRINSKSKKGKGKPPRKKQKR
ncbi:12424_t:CDS:10 [Ambispora leptoticha]|uniref:12424_t:CDS:1 n=1 Tax=Ambispora leptoticha TaxID=144679 RepID=A0A9N8VAC0_9GLOM|nr:12424_t:CDS:10 [Ambispora leptoticha]